MTIGEKIIALVHEKSLVHASYDPLDPTMRPVYGWSRGSVDQLDALVAAHVEEQVRLRLEENIETIESCARQDCHTSRVTRDYMGQVAGTLVTDSGAISARAQALEFLAALTPPRFRIVAGSGRMVVGYWPENDPAKQATTF